MFSFYLYAALFVALALALVLLPVLRTPKNASAARSAGLREELAALNALHDDGVLTESDFTARRDELSAKALALLADPAAAKTRIGAAPLWTGAALLLCLPIAVMLIYQAVGTPNAVAFAAGGKAFSAAQAAQQAPGAATQASSSAGATGDSSGKGIDLKQAAVSLRARLESAPEDGEGWLLLGKTYMELSDYAGAKTALSKALAALPEDAELYALYGEAIGLANRPNPPPAEAEMQIDKALALDQNNQRGLWLKGVFRRLAGDVSGARSAWQSLAQLLPAGSELLAGLQQQLDELDAVAPRVNASPGPSPGPSAAAAPAAGASVALAAAPGATDSGVTGPDAAKPGSLQVRIEITPELKAKLAANDVLFVFAKAQSGPPMPLAIARLAARDLPLEVTLDDSSAMMEGMKLSMFPAVNVGARVSKTGVATASSGDFQAQLVAITQPASGQILLRISTVVP
jgi:cytochrome c-type biogenesis protein CcmH